MSQENIELRGACETGDGRRFRDEVLAYQLNGKSLTDVLAMTVQQALEFFDIKEIVSMSRPDCQNRHDDLILSDFDSSVLTNI